VQAQFVSVFSNNALKRFSFKRNSLRFFTPTLTLSLLIEFILALTTGAVATFCINCGAVDIALPDGLRPYRC
jgi:hypothetical protein